MLPADCPFLSTSLISEREGHEAFFPNANSAACSIISQSSLNLVGHVITDAPLCHILQTPRGLFALSFVQFGTLLLKGQSFFFRYRCAFELSFSIGKPKTSPRGLLCSAFFAMINNNKFCRPIEIFVGHFHIDPNS